MLQFELYSPIPHISQDDTPVGLIRSVHAEEKHIRHREQGRRVCAPEGARRAAESTQGGDERDGPIGRRKPKDGRPPPPKSEWEVTALCGKDSGELRRKRSLGGRIMQRSPSAAISPARFPEKTREQEAETRMVQMRQMKSIQEPGQRDPTLRTQRGKGTCFNDRVGCGDCSDTHRACRHRLCRESRTSLHQC